MKIYNKTPKWREREVYKSMCAAPLVILSQKGLNTKYPKQLSEGSKHDHEQSLGEIKEQD